MSYKFIYDEAKQKTYFQVGIALTYASVLLNTQRAHDCAVYVAVHNRNIFVRKIAKKSVQCLKPHAMNITVNVLRQIGSRIAMKFNLVISNKYWLGLVVNNHIQVKLTFMRCSKVFFNYFHFS